MRVRPRLATPLLALLAPACTGHLVQPLDVSARPEGCVVLLDGDPQGETSKGALRVNVPFKDATQRHYLQIVNAVGMKKFEQLIVFRSEETPQSIVVDL